MYKKIKKLRKSKDFSTNKISILNKSDIPSSKSRVRYKNKYCILTLHSRFCPNLTRGTWNGRTDASLCENAKVVWRFNAHVRKRTTRVPRRDCPRWLAFATPTPVRDPSRITGNRSYTRRSKTPPHLIRPRLMSARPRRTGRELLFPSACQPLNYAASRCRR